MSRFFADYTDAGVVALSNDNAEHIVKTLRLSQGDGITVCDGAGTDYSCVITGVSRNPYTVTADIIGKRPNENEPPYEITLFQAIPKGDKFDDVVRMCVELGVHAIAPLITERVVTKNVRAERLAGIAEAAAKQCGRGIIPKILSAVDICGCVEQSKTADLRVCPWEEYDGQQSLKSALNKFSREESKKICVVIGPEGGLAAKEVETLKGGGFIPVTLGKRILRTQTAGAAVLAMILYELEI